MSSVSNGGGIPPGLAERIREFLWTQIVAAPEMKIWLRFDESAPHHVEFTQSTVYPLSSGAVTDAKQLIEDLRGI